MTIKFSAFHFENCKYNILKVSYNILVHISQLHSISHTRQLVRWNMTLNYTSCQLWIWRRCRNPTHPSLPNPLESHWPGQPLPGFLCPCCLPPPNGRWSWSVGNPSRTAINHETNNNFKTESYIKRIQWNPFDSMRNGYERCASRNVSYSDIIVEIKYTDERKCSAVIALFLGCSEVFSSLKPDRPAIYFLHFQSEIQNRFFTSSVMYKLDVYYV